MIRVRARVVTRIRVDHRVRVRVVTHSYASHRVRIKVRVMTNTDKLCESQG